MIRIDRQLLDAGYRVINPTYPSLWKGIEELAEATIPPAVEACRGEGTGPISFVTHSMGGILVRVYLAANTLPELRRVVMLGPPNQGSELASWATSFDMLEGIRPQAVGELSRELHSLTQRLGPVRFDLGVIAGNRNRRAFLPGVPEEASDGTVAVAETRIDGMRDFIELPTTHTFIVWSEDVMHQILTYLRTGRFDHSQGPGASISRAVQSSSGSPPTDPGTDDAPAATEAGVTNR
jgi:hypothetical protein